ncbi:MAG: class I SAM-dependent methyltransferase [Pseudomonadota bacterium]|nr:class I SAM-dependent methyltransferase [Pseudomonadota bacterium]
MPTRWLARQFACPHGLAGRLIFGPWLDRIGAAMNRLVLDELAPGPRDRLLEIGFGGGALLRDFLAAGSAEVTGVDLSEAMVKRARRRFRRALAEGRLRLVHGSVEALPLAAASIDKAASVNNIYFWPEPAAAAAELARVIRPGGTLAVALEPPEELAKWPGHVHGFRPWSEAEVKALLGAAGFGRFRTASGTGRKPDYFLCLTAERLAPQRG